MALSEFPPTLPLPSVSGTTPAERRAASDLSGPLQLRGWQADYLARQRVEWFLTPAQASIFDAWWKADQTSGGAWFAATWPSPQGLVSLVRRFISTPQWKYVAGSGHWVVSAQVQVRGRGIAPGFTDPMFDDVILLNHMDGISGATVTSSVGPNLILTGGTGSISGLAARFGDAGARGTADTHNFGTTSLSLAMNSDLTIEGHFKWSGAGSTRLFAFGPSGLGRLIAGYCTAGLLEVYVNSPVLAAYLPITQYFVAGIYSHIAVQFNAAAGSVTAFMDGSSVGSYSGFSWASSSFTDFQLGGFSGDYDEVRITKRIRYGSPYTAPTSPFPDH